MGLTAENELGLRDAGLIAFYEKNKGDFAGVTKKSYDFAADQVAQIKLPLRRDDVCTFLVPALKTHEKLREELARKKLRQKYWYERFADLILDRSWDDLEKAKSGKPNGKGD